MSKAPRGTLLDYLRQTVGRHGPGDTADAALLRRFGVARDPEALAALVRRHGPMVLALCRRLLRDAHDAEDAFQTTFLVLVRKADAVGRPELLANWLYVVAYRTALKIKAAAVRRRLVESRTPLPPAAGPADDLLWRDLRPVLDREIQRLSDKYRVPFVLCCLESKTNAEAARLLGCPEGTVLSRLARARELLRARLTRRGITLGGALLATLLADRAAPAAVPAALVDATVAAGLFGAAASASLNSVAERVVKAMFWHKGKLAVAAALGLGVAGLAAGVLTRPAEGREPDAPVARAYDEAGPDEGAARKAVTASLERSRKVYVELAGTFWDPGEPIPLTAVVSPVPTDAQGPKQWKGNWDRMAAVTGPAGTGRRYQVQVQVFKEGTDKAVWSGRQAIDPGPLARLSRDTVSDGKTLQTMFDPDAAAALRVPAGAVKPGTYRVTLSFLDPDGDEHAFHNGDTPRTGRYLVVRAAPLDWKTLLMPSQSADAADLLARATEIANPGRRQFPKNDPDDCQARSVWCLQAFQGRVYVGGGDWDRNRGPIDVWSFAPESADAKARYPGRFSFAAGDAPRLLFAKEYAVQEESIERFRVLGDKLVVPGLDGNKANGPDGLLFSSLYLREKGSWRKLSSLPGGHVMDVAEFGGRLVAGVAGVRASADGGLSWQDLAPGQPSLGAEEFVPFRDGLLIFGDGEGGSLYRDGKLETRVTDFFPGYGFGRAHRSTPFLGGVVYTSHHAYGMSKEARHPLLFLKEFKEGPRVIELFRDKAVRDILAEGDRLYVLTGRAEGKGFVGEIHATKDLRAWTRSAAFRVPAMPGSFARLGGEWYVGLANRGYDAATYSDHKAHRYAFADEGSGGIWRLGH